MAVNKKAIKGGGLVQLRNSDTTSDGSVVNETETWTGDYAELKIKRDAVFRAVKGTSLVPTEANQGELKITREIQLASDPANRPPSVETIEVLWQELRQPIQLSPYFDDMDIVDKNDVLWNYQDTAYSPGDNEKKQKLYDDLVNEREYVTGVPVVRRTTTNVQGNVGSGNAWFRDEPPVTVDGDWEFLKTGDERRETGRRFDQVEEWTGATVWDEDHYP